MYVYIYIYTHTLIRGSDVFCLSRSGYASVPLFTQPVPVLTPLFTQLDVFCLSRSGYISVPAIGGKLCRPLRRGAGNRLGVVSCRFEEDAGVLMMYHWFT